MDRNSAADDVRPIKLFALPHWVHSICQHPDLPLELDGCWAGQLHILMIRYKSRTTNLELNTDPVMYNALLPGHSSVPWERSRGQSQ